MLIFSSLGTITVAVLLSVHIHSVFFHGVTAILTIRTFKETAAHRSCTTVIRCGRRFVTGNTCGNVSIALCCFKDGTLITIIRAGQWQEQELFFRWAQTPKDNFGALTISLFKKYCLTLKNVKERIVWCFVCL